MTHNTRVSKAIVWLTCLLTGLLSSCAAYQSGCAGGTYQHLRQTSWHNAQKRYQLATEYKSYPKASKKKQAKYYE